MWNSLLIMKLHFALILLCACNLAAAKGGCETHVTLEELQELNSTCPSDNTCNGEELDNPFNPFADCNCGIFCAQLGTCCLASAHVLVPGPKLKPTCRSTGYLMIDRCPQSSRSKSPYEDLCNEEREEESDLMRLAPVTSLYSHITYKNYFCFLCHESNDDYIFWNVAIMYDGETDVKLDDSNVQLAYDEYYKTWVAPVGEGGSFESVNLEFAAPVSILSITKACSPSLITDCSVNWLDDDVRAKCHAYMHVISIKRDDETTQKFKNPHCALCNYEDLSKTYCPVLIAAYPAKRPFSFTFLLDVNRSDGDKVGKVERCSGSGIWDPYFKKCRTLQCALPGYVVQDGECVVP